jgi:hypothetical protein
MAGLAKLWWDQILDGRPYEVDLRNTPYRNLMALRSACYREADSRHRLVATSKRGVYKLGVQAWGNPDLPRMPQSQPTFDNDIIFFAAPTRAELVQSYEPPRRSSPAPQDQPPSDTEPLIEEDTEALLGPCTCGQDPTCLPSCERFS